MSEQVVETRPEADPLGQLAVIPDAAALDLMADPSQYVITACERAKTWLTQALEHGDIKQIVELKSQAEAIRIYTMQKQLGKDAELAASEIVRRAERGIGGAIRKGQDAGEILRTGETLRRPTSHPGDDDSRMKLSPVEASGVRYRSEVSDFYQMVDNVSDEQFEAAIEDGKAEQNLSRASVVRKLKGQKSSQERHDLLKGTRHHNPERIINETVIALDGLCLGLALLEPDDFNNLAPEKAQDWSSSLRTSLRTLNQLAKGLNHARA